MILIVTIFSFLSVLSGDISFPFEYTITKQNNDSFLFHYYYDIPYPKLFFLKKNEKFASRYQISIQIWNRNELVTGKTFIRDFVIDNYDDTKSTTLNHSDSINLVFSINNLKDNTKLLAKVVFNDLNSNNTGRLELEFRPPILFSKLKFFKNHLPNPTRTYSTEAKETLNIYMEIYSETLKSCSLFIIKISEEQISGYKPKQKSTILKDYIQLKESEDFSKINFNYSHPLANLANVTSGQYQIRIIGYDINNKTVFKINDTFLIKNSFFYSNNEYFEMVNRLLYIATLKEMKKLYQAQPAKRESLWKAFFKQHDPTPTTAYNETEQEYFSRIDYCIKNFSKGDKGYKSDRAKIYMRYGPADFIEVRPYEQFSNAYEIWYYYNIGKQFIFTDAHGFGEFVLYEEKRL